MGVWSGGVWSAGGWVSGLEGVGVWSDGGWVSGLRGMGVWSEGGVRPPPPTPEMATAVVGNASYWHAFLF